VVKVSKSGGATKVLGDGYIYPFGIAVDASYVYVAVGGAGDQDDGQIVRMPR
jgi:hypothetical protein